MKKFFLVTFSAVTLFFASSAVLASTISAGDLVTVAPPCEFRESDINDINLKRGHHTGSNQGVAVDFGHSGGEATTDGGKKLEKMSCIGKSVLASISGKVRRFWDNGGGNMLAIEDAARGIEVRYLHLADYTGSPANGAFVEQGKRVGTIGNTGNSSGTHLHFEVWQLNPKRALTYKSYTDSSNRAEEWRFGNYGVQGPNLSRFNFAQDSQGWQIANAMSFVFDGGRQPKYLVTGNDPHLVSPVLNLTRADYRYVEVDIEYNGGFPHSSCVQLFIMETGDTNFSESKVFNISSATPLSSSRGKIVFDLGQYSNIFTKLTRLRLDPTCGGNPTVTIHSIRLYNDLQAYAVHQFWSDTKQNHFYTSSDDEKNDVLATYPQSIWKYERIAFRAFDSNLNYPPSVGLLPVYRFWNDSLQSHFYTIFESEKQDLINNPGMGWVYERVAFKAFSAPYQNYTVPVYRFWSASLQAHFYTTSESEKADLINNPSKGWKYEMVAFHVLP